MELASWCFFLIGRGSPQLMFSTLENTVQALQRVACNLSPNVLLLKALKKPLRSSIGNRDCFIFDSCNRDGIPPQATFSNRGNSYIHTESHWIISQKFWLHERTVKPPIFLSWLRMTSFWQQPKTSLAWPVLTVLHGSEVTATTTAPPPQCCHSQPRTLVA